MNLKVRSLNLSLSSACGANCIFCPDDRGQRIRTKNMPLSLVDKILDEVCSGDFVSRFELEKIEIGENGDAFINKETIGILRLIKRRLPEITVSIFTNFQNFTMDKLETVVSEGLVSGIGFNIDGHNEQNFFASKRISINYVLRGVKELCSLRKKYNANIHFYGFALTYYHYIAGVYNVFGRYPAKFIAEQSPPLVDDFDQIRSMIEPLIEPGDSFGRSQAFFWAERPLVDPSTIDYQQHSCPMITRVYNEAFIAPDGTWYACCYDSDNKLALGNVWNNRLDEIAVSENRINLLRELAQKKFSEIGEPCNTVNCCEGWPKVTKDK